MITSLEKLGTHAALSKEHARRCLKYLERTHAVTLRTTHHWTMITVVNWTTYQQSDDDAQHTEQHAEQHTEQHANSKNSPRSTTHAATLSKEVNNLDKKNMSNSDELDSAPATAVTISRRKPTKQIDPDVQAWFEAEFWPLYPRREGKPKALEAANTAATTPEKRATYIAGLKVQLPEYNRRKRESGQSTIPMASTWFNQDRVSDQFAPAPERHNGARPAPQDDYPAYEPLAGREG
jgi:hypothetical protein